MLDIETANAYLSIGTSDLLTGAFRHGLSSRTRQRRNRFCTDEISRCERSREGISKGRGKTVYGLDYIWIRMHNMGKSWEVIFYDEFERESRAFDEELQDELLAHAILLRNYGPILGRPTVDTLKGSRHANMKELRFDWRENPGGLRSHATPREGPSSSPAATRQGSIRGGSTESSSLSPIDGSTLTWRRWASRRAVEEERG